MRLVVGLPGNATAASLGALVDAGAAEFFAGYVPARWSQVLGYEVSPNRRYRAAHQVTSAAQLAALAAAAHARDARFVLALNEHEYSDETWAAALELAREARASGVDGFITAGPATTAAVRAAFPDAALHASGELGTVNVAAVRWLAELGATRVIFPRGLRLAVLERLVAATRAAGLEAEAFAMGEPCAFDGARCFTDHGYGLERDFCTCHRRRWRQTRGGRDAVLLRPATAEVAGTPDDVLALGKCGLCALPLLAAMGVTHAKLPGRASTALRATALARRVLDEGLTPEEVPALLGVPALCRSGAFCYFPEARKLRP